MQAEKNLSTPVFRWSALIFFSVGLLLFGWLATTPAGLLGKADAIGYAVCHRIDGRSLHLGERALPLCVRCSGMYLGAVLGIGFQAIIGNRRSGAPARKFWLIYLLFVAAFGLDGINSYASLFPNAPYLYEPQNALRLVTGTGMGLSIAAFLYPSFNQTVWKEMDGRPAIGTWRQLIGLFILAAALDLIVLTENPLMLYPLALFSAAGVLLILTMVYTMVWLIIFKIENRFESFHQMSLALLGGFGFGLLQIVFLDLLRYFLTGTWDGFHIG